MGFENGKLVRVVLRASHPSQGDQVNVLHYDLIDQDLQGANDPQSLADAFRDDVMPKVEALYVPAWSIQPVEVVMERDPLNPNAPRSAWTSGVVTAGTRVTSAQWLPAQCCAVASLRTANIGRRARGRMFLGGTLTEADMTDAAWDPTMTALWQALLDAIPRQPDISPPGSESTANWCVYSRTQRAANLDPYAPHVQQVLLSNEVHWLRSRQP